MVLYISYVKKGKANECHFNMRQENIIIITVVFALLFIPVLFIYNPQILSSTNRAMEGINLDMNSLRHEAENRKQNEEYN